MCCKSKSCNGLCCSYSNPGLVATVNWKEEVVVGLILASKKGGQECLPKPITCSWLGLESSAVSPSSNGRKKTPRVALTCQHWTLSEIPPVCLCAILCVQYCIITMLLLYYMMLLVLFILILVYYIYVLFKLFIIAIC